MPPKILYIEDDPQQIEIFKLFLARENLEVLTARDGISGLRIIRAELPALVFLDINLPAMTGIEIAETLRADPDHAHIPLVALTSTMKYSHQTSDITTLFDTYLSKPVMRKDVLECIRALLAPARP